MDKLRIVGGRRLSGRVEVSGAKNAALPAMAAALLTSDVVVLDNVPDVWDVGTMRRVLMELGAQVSRVDPTDPHVIQIRAATLFSHEAPYELVKTMRASVLVLGPLVARGGRARVSLPGGCAIGARPIDLHTAALQKLGARIKVEHGFVEASTEGLRGAEISFNSVTVTGTENVMMAATLARGETVLTNCAQEPEVVDLANLLVNMGGHIEGAGTQTIRVHGVERLHGATHTIIPDRIEAGTFITAGALVGDDIEVVRCRPGHLSAVLEKLIETGAGLEPGSESVRVRSQGAPRPANVRTLPYPAFPTDMQAQFMALMTQASGTSVITETIFENRFMHAAELTRMGASIQLDGHMAIVNGPTRLTGARVMATDLRASACLILAGLAADGPTVIDRVYHLDRGYERIEEKLACLGAQIERVTR